MWLWIISSSFLYVLILTLLEDIAAVFLSSERAGAMACLACGSRCQIAMPSAPPSFPPLYYKSHANLRNDDEDKESSLFLKRRVSQSALAIINMARAF